MKNPFTDDAIVQPVIGKNPPNMGPATVMVSSRPDLSYVCDNLNLDSNNIRILMMSRLYAGIGTEAPWSAVGPIVGAPYAVMVLDSLVAWGARRVIFFGWCGAISPGVNIGDIILPTGAYIDEGTSRQYDHDANGQDAALPSGELTDKLAESLERHELPFHKGNIWSTDGIFRETPEKVKDYRDRGALAVEMELSALFTVGRFRNIDVAGILVVSDDVSTFEWRRGFKSPEFKNF